MTDKLKDLLVPMRLPGEDEFEDAKPSTGFPPKIQAELKAKLARCEAMLVETDVTPRLVHTVSTLADARNAAGLTQAEVAERMKVTQSTVSQIESATNDARLSTLRRYAKAVGCRLDVTLTDLSAATGSEA